MATRPCFRPLENVVALYEEIERADPAAKVLEISRGSPQSLGASLSAFNLRMDLDGARCAVESVFLASQVFPGGTGPFPKLCSQDACDVALFVGEEAGARPVVAFELGGERWNAESRTAFFFNLYLKALRDNPGLADRLMEYGAFTDTGSSPENRIASPAAAAALYVSLRRRNMLEWAMLSRENFLCACRVPARRRRGSVR